jgi:hypothetical protein
MLPEWQKWFGVTDDVPALHDVLQAVGPRPAGPASAGGSDAAPVVGQHRDLGQYLVARPTLELLLPMTRRPGGLQAFKQIIPAGWSRTVAMTLSARAIFHVPGAMKNSSAMLSGSRKEMPLP